MSAASRWFAAAGLFLAPAMASACPACARNFSNPMTYALVATMIGVPYVISMVVIRVIRRIETEDAAAASAGSSQP